MPQEQLTLKPSMYCIQYKNEWAVISSGRADLCFLLNGKHSDFTTCNCQLIIIFKKQTLSMKEYYLTLIQINSNAIHTA